MTDKENENEGLLLKKIILLLDKGRTKNEITKTIYHQEKDLLRILFHT
jgi:hypothetical protein